MTVTRRHLLRGGSAAMIVGAIAGNAAAASLPEAPMRGDPRTAPPPLPASGPPFRPVVTLNGWSLPWRMKDGWKEFHLVAEPVERELAPGMVARLWGYNGQSPGPTIEAVEGDKVRLFVTNRLPEHTTAHWHGLALPNGMDGVGGLTQLHIGPGKTFVYEFQLRRSGTFMYHPHADEMVQMAMGMMGLFIVHPRDPGFMAVDRDFAFLLASYAIAPGAAVPKVAEMTDFNIWTFNSRVFPGIDALAIRRGDRVRIRVGNLTMTNHPIHIHGHDLTVTGTDGGWIAPSARWPEVSVDVPVGAMRAIEFVAEHEGDWALHCHKAHHTMNAMGHGVRTYIGVDKREVARRIRALLPDYMPMGSTGMAEMGDMEMPLPENTLPMMTGQGPFGPMEMGGMFTVAKIRAGLAAGDHRDPGWFKHPPGTVAYEWTGPAATLARPRRAAAPDRPADLHAVRRARPGGGNHQH